MLDMGKHIDRANDGLVAIIQHLSSIEEGIHALLVQTSDRRPERWDAQAGAQAAGGASVTVGPIPVPMGKRMTLKRISTTAPVNTGPCLVYATTGGGAFLDGGNLREVIPVPNFYASEVSSWTVVDGGMQLYAVFQAVPAGGGTLTIRYEGELYDAVAADDVGH